MGDTFVSESKGSSFWGRLPPCDYFDTNTTPSNKPLLGVPMGLRNCEITYSSVSGTHYPDSSIFNSIVVTSEIGIDGQLDGLQRFASDRTFYELSCYDNGVRVHTTSNSENENEVVSACQEIRSTDRLAAFIKSECNRLGLTIDSSDYNQCLIQLRLGFMQKTIKAGTADSVSVRTPASTNTASRLQGLAQILNGLKTANEAGNSAAQNNTSNTPPLARTCNYKAGSYRWAETTNLKVCPSSSSKGGLTGILVF